MKLLIVGNMSVDRLPPIRNLITILLRKGHTVTVLTPNSADSLKSLSAFKSRLRCIVFKKYEGKNVIVKTFDYFRSSFYLRRVVKNEMKDHDVLWTTTDMTLARLGGMIFKYKHVMQLMELVEYIPAIPGQKIFKINAKRYAQHALCVVVPEYNRAHITKAWWDLEELPIVLPNKPVDESIDLQNVPEGVQNTLRELEKEKRKIILYQGVFNKDRDLSKFAEAIDELSDEYTLYVMGKREGREWFIDPLLNEHKNIHYIPFILPPYHLLVTERAYIGLLPYKSTKKMPCSALNAVYCAPNKIFEYAKCGVPMLGSDVPGLTHSFSLYDIGYICETQSKNEIKELVLRIGENYSHMRENCKKFYKSVDLDEIVDRILTKIES